MESIYKNIWFIVIGILKGLIYQIVVYYYIHKLISQLIYNH